MEVIKKMIPMLKSLNVADDVIVKQLVEQYSFSEEDAKKCLSDMKH